jgi:hypothetical protein
VCDLRTIRENETDHPVKVTALVAPLATKFAQAAELSRPEYRKCGRHFNYSGRSEFDLERRRERPFVVKVADDARA